MNLPKQAIGIVHLLAVSKLDIFGLIKEENQTTFIGSGKNIPSFSTGKQLGLRLHWHLIGITNLPSRKWNILDQYALFHKDTK